MTRCTRDISLLYEFIVLFNIKLTVQLLPYNHSSQIESHVPEISGTSRNNTSLYACCEKWREVARDSRPTWARDGVLEWADRW